MLLSSSVKYWVAKLNPDCKSVLGPVYWILEMADVNAWGSDDNSETKLASSIVPSLETSAFVEKLTTPTFKLSFPLRWYWLKY